MQRNASTRTLVVKLQSVTDETACSANMLKDMIIVRKIGVIFILQAKKCSFCSNSQIAG
jgi:hypothetical protein